MDLEWHFDRYRDHISSPGWYTIFSVLRREVKKDRQEFETKVIALLEEIKNTQE